MEPPQNTCLYGALLLATAVLRLEERFVLLEAQMGAIMNRLRATAWLREGVRVITLHRRSYLAEPKRQPASGVKALPRIVVTLSTLPGRIDKIFPALNSLLDQTLMPKQIILAIPEYSRREQKAYMIPDALLNHSPPLFQTLLISYESCPTPLPR